MSTPSTGSITSLDQHSRFVRQPDSERLITLGNRFCERLPALLTSYFTHADEFLFNTAEKSVDGFAANQYFDQLRQLRKQRDSLQQSIVKDIRRWISAGFSLNEPTQSDSSDLSIMEEQELERDLAISSFANRVYERANTDWLAWHERMLAVSSVKSLSNKETPYNPYVFGVIVFKQLDSTGFPLKTILMLFKLFDDKAINELLDFYHTNNHWLIEEGILPNLKLGNKRRERRRNNISSSDLTHLASLLSARQPNQATDGSDNSNTQFQHNTSMTTPGGVQVDPAFLSRLMESFNLLQQSVAPAATNIAELKQWANAQAEQVSKTVQGRQESETISLVAMLFEYILDDEQLSPYMKQLLARMQIPIIKVALLDDSFFQHSDHSARQLLNKMAKAANGWHKDENVENDALFIGMEAIVDQLNHDLDEDIELFDALLIQFTDLLEIYKKNTAIKLDRLESAEAAIVTAHESQDRTRIFIDTLLDDQTLPESIDTLLRNQWYQLMAAVFKKQGECQAWKTSARIARELIWSLQASVQVTHAKRFSAIVPKLLSGLQDGLNSLGLSESERKNIIRSIEDQHAIYSGQLDENIWDAQSQLESFEAHASAAEKVIDAELPLPVDEPVQELRQADLSYYLDQVESLALEQWFDIELKPQQVQRGRLSLIVSGGAKYIFTDAQGEKIAERSAIGLAMAMRDEIFTAIDDDPLFDRMIDSIVDDIDMS